MCDQTVTTPLPAAPQSGIGVGEPFKAAASGLRLLLFVALLLALVLAGAWTGPSADSVALTQRLLPLLVPAQRAGGAQVQTTKRPCVRPAEAADEFLAPSPGNPFHGQSQETV